MPPPKLLPVDLIYSEQEIWTRLEIREFLFRFGHLYSIDSRTLAPLQNVQGDWRMKRLGGILVWKCLMVLTTNGSVCESEVETIKTAKKIMYDWIEERELGLIYDNLKEQQQAFMEILQLEGMNAQRWKDVSQITGKPAGDEFQTTLGLLELLLFENSARNSFVTVKENNKELKEYQTSESAKRSRRQQLTNKVHQLESLSRKEAEIKLVREQLELIETEIRDDRAVFHSKQLEHTRQCLRSNKRTQCAGHDRLGNAYWIFSDLVDQACRNSEPYWAYGIIVIGPGYKKSESVRWWAIEGRKEMERLSKWLKWNHDQYIKPLVDLIQHRIDYLNSLEWAIYGQGFFS